MRPDTRDVSFKNELIVLEADQIQNNICKPPEHYFMFSEGLFPVGDSDPSKVPLYCWPCWAQKGG